jgi:hypothetical protein
MLQTGGVIPNHYPTEYSSDATHNVDGRLGAYICTASVPATWTLPDLSGLLDGTELLIYNESIYDLTIQAPQPIGNKSEIIITPFSSTRLLTSITKWIVTTTPSSPVITAPIIDSSPVGPSIATLYNGSLLTRPRSGWEWAITSASSPSSDISTHMATISRPGYDTDKCIILVGTFTGTITLGSTVLTAISPRDMFLTCIRPNVTPGEAPTYLWSKQYAINIGDDLTPRVKYYAPDFMIFVSGYYQGNNVDFGNGYTAPNSPYNAGFLLEVMSNGTTSYLYTAIGTNTVEFTDMSVSGDKIYISVNSRSSSITLDPTAITFTSTANTNQRAAIVCFDLDNYDWFWGISSSSTTMVNATSVYEYGDRVHLTGEFTGTLTCGSQTITSPVDSPSMFIAFAADTDGSWQNKLLLLGTTGTTIRPYDIIFKGTLAYIIGAFNGTATFGDKVINSYGDLDIFVACTDGAFASFGSTWQWAIKAGSVTADAGISTISDDTSLYITGTISGTSTFGTLTYTQTDTTPQIFIARLSLTGTWIWLTTTTGTGGTRSGNCVAILDSKVVVCGANSGTTNFGPVPIVSTSNDIVIGKIDVTSPFPVMLTAGGTRGDSLSFNFVPAPYAITTLNGTTLVANKNYYYHPETGLVNIQSTTSSDLYASIPIGTTITGYFLFKPQV